MVRPKTTNGFIPFLMLLLTFSAAAGHAQDSTTPLSEEPAVSDSSGTRVVIETNLGNITLRLYDDLTPKTVENFLGLARKGYYDGVIFHRVIRGFMMQGGDPTGTGYGGKSLWGEPFEDEIVESLKFDRRGILAMANGGPGTNGSQFFITFAPTPWLNGKHTIFGEVIDGMDVLDKVEAAEVGPRDKPVEEIVIQHIDLPAEAAGPDGR